MIVQNPRKSPQITQARAQRGLACLAVWLACAAIVAAQSVKLSWNPNPESDIAGYVVHYGTQSGNLTETKDVVGQVTTTTLEQLQPSTTYFFALQAYNTSGLYSDMTEQISHTTAAAAPTGPVIADSSGNTLPPAGATIDHGVVRVGAIGEARTFTLTNYGTTTLTGLRLVSNDPASLDFEISGIPYQLAPVRNGSFENDLQNWTASGSVRALSATARHGSKRVEFSYGNSANDGVLNQSFATRPGTTYRLEFEMGVLAFNTNSQWLRVALNGNSQSFSMNGAGGGAITWTPRSMEFTADSTSTTLSFQDISTVTNGIDMLLDDVRVTDLSAAAVEPVVSSLAAGKSLTFTITFKPGRGGSASPQFSLLTDNSATPLYEIAMSGTGAIGLDGWLSATGAAGGSAGNPDGDGLNNLLEYAFGTNPQSGQTGGVAAENGQVISRGTPAALVISDPENESNQFQGLFGRRKDHAMFGLRYQPQFSADLLTWQDATALPVTVAEDGEIEIVAVTAPDMIGGMPARFFRVGVSQRGPLTYQEWTAAHSLVDGDQGNADGDALNNLMEFAFGTDPKVAQASSAAESAGAVAGRGAPNVRVNGTPGTTGFEFNGIFCRRKDRTETGVEYRPQFSADLLTWQNATAAPAVLADDGEIEVVAVKAPETIGGQAVRFFRVGVNRMPDP
jgi:hypothetical protein